MRLVCGVFGVCGIILSGSAIAAPVDYSNPANQWHGSAQSGSASYGNSSYDLNLGIEGGYRTSQLKWNIASEITGTATPNILSELQWKNVQGYEAAPKIDYTQKTGSLRGLHLEADVNKSITYSGKNQDSDYLGDFRTGEFSRSNNNSDGGYSEGFSAGVGYSFNFGSSGGKTLSRFTTLVGYAMQRQKFVMRDGNQTLSDFGFPVPTGPFDGLRSSYTMDWRAPFIGLEFDTHFTRTQRFGIDGRYYRGNYDGTGNWNLRSDLQHPKSFRQKADGDGYQIAAEYGWEFRPRWELTVSAGYTDFKTDSGKDIAYFSDGTSGTTRFNEAEWKSQNYRTGLNYRF